MSVHAYDHRESILGQATLALELDDQAGPLDTVLVPVGGGGLIAGIASTSRAACGSSAWSQKARRPCSAPGRRAHPLSPGRKHRRRCPRPAPRRRSGLPTTQAYVADVVLVDDDAIRGAQRTLWETARIAAEPAASVGVAALLGGAYKPAPGERVAVVISGANMTPSQLAD